MSDVASVMDSIVMEEMARLTVSPFNELINLPPYSTKQVVRDDHKFSVTIYHDPVSLTEHQIVVQVFTRRWLGLCSWVHVDGFVLKSPTERRDLTDEERWPYT